MSKNTAPTRRTLVKFLATSPLLPFIGGVDCIAAPQPGNGRKGAIPGLPRPALGLGYDTLDGYTFDHVAGARHNLLASCQLQGSGMIQLLGGGVEAADASADTIGARGSLFVTGTLPGDDPAAYGVMTLLVHVAPTARNASFKQIQVVVARGTVSQAVNFNVMLRPGRHTLALDMATQCPLVVAAGRGPTTVRVAVNQSAPNAANVSVDALLVNAKGRPTWVVTGDDGYKTHRDVLWPILKARHIPLTMYIPTAQVGEGSGKFARLSWADLRAFKALAGEALSYGTNTTTDVSVLSYASKEAASGNLRQSWADFTAERLDSPAMYHMALSNGEYSEAQLAALDAAGMKTYRSTRSPTDQQGNFTRFGIYQNNVMSRGFGTKADSSPTIPLATTMAAMDHNDAIGGTMFVHFHQVGATYADCGAIGCTTDYATAVADRIKASVDAGGVALTVDQWYARDSVQLFPDLS